MCHCTFFSTRAIHWSHLSVRYLLQRFAFLWIRPSNCEHCKAQRRQITRTESQRAQQQYVDYAKTRGRNSGTPQLYMDCKIKVPLIKHSACGASAINIWSKSNNVCVFSKRNKGTECVHTAEAQWLKCVCWVQEEWKKPSFPAGISQ